MQSYHQAQLGVQDKGYATKEQSRMATGSTTEGYKAIYNKFGSSDCF